MLCISISLVAQRFDLQHGVSDISRIARVAFATVNQVSLLLIIDL